jgi:1-acyl-sn-glycerol-3-phosphate acyltransferase
MTDPLPRIRPAIWWPARLLVGGFFRGPLRMTRVGRERLPRSGGVLIVSNHVSYRDPPAVGAAALPRPVRFMARSELFRVGVFGRLISGLGAFRVVRGTPDRDAIRMARALLAAGECVVMFPEGTRSPNGRLRPGFPGSGALALEPGISVIPAAVWGTQRRFGPVRVVFGEPLDLSDLAGAGGARGVRAQEATRRIMAAIAALLPQAGGPVQDPPEGVPALPVRSR